jgi:hypothetical protein
MAAFERIDKGVLPKLFDPKMEPGELPGRKWSRSFAADEIKIHAAACMDALMKSGVGKNEAAVRVERHADNWPRGLKGSQGVSSRPIR